MFENGAGNDAIDTLIWDVRGQFMGVGDEVYVLPRLIVHTDIRGRVKGPGAMAGVALSRRCRVPFIENRQVMDVEAGFAVYFQ